MNIEQTIEKIERIFQDSKNSRRKISYTVDEFKDGIPHRRGGRYEDPGHLRRIMDEASGDGTEKLRVDFYAGGVKSNRVFDTATLDYLNNTGIMGAGLGRLYGSEDADKLAARIRKEVRGEMMQKKLSDDCAYQSELIRKLKRQINALKRQLESAEHDNEKLLKLTAALRKKMQSEKWRMGKAIGAVALQAGAHYLEEKQGMKGLGETVSPFLQILVDDDLDPETENELDTDETDIEARIKQRKNTIIMDDDDDEPVFQAGSSITTVTSQQLTATESETESSPEKGDEDDFDDAFFDEETY